MSRDSRNLGPPGKMETGDPLAGTERKEVRAKNIGMMECCALGKWENAVLTAFFLTKNSKLFVNERSPFILKFRAYIPF